MTDQPTTELDPSSSDKVAVGGRLPRLVAPCRCEVWACDDISKIFNGNGHHPRCEHYAVPPTDPRFAAFGRAVWDYIRRRGGEFCEEEISEDILPLATWAGLCERVAYDPAIHGDGIDAEPGSEIWYWGNDPSQAPRP